MSVGRLAPTPSGHLHLGNVVAFGGAWLSARAAGGRLLLRVEDVDGVRADPGVEAGIREDLAWLGLHVDAETPPQSQRSYAEALARLAPSTYRCTCTRAQVRAAGGVYPGTCRQAGHTEGAVRFRLPEGPVVVRDRARGEVVVHPQRTLGDPVLVRRDGVVAYGLAVVVDDVRDGVTEVVRGADLLEITAVQLPVWAALGAPPPTWLHTPLVMGTDGRKLSKSHGSTEVRALRATGWRAEDVWAVVLPWLGVEGARDLAGALPRFRPEAVPRGPFTWASPSSPPAPLPR